MSYKRIAFLGLGQIGFPIAQNIAEAFPGGIAFDPYVAEERATALTKREWSVAESLADVIAYQPELLITCLPNTEVVEGVFREISVIERLGTGTVIMDMTTGYPADSQRAYAPLRAAGYHVVEAPIVSGGVDGAYDGQLTLALYGDDDVLERLQSLLGVITSTTLPVAEPGQAQYLKLISNFLIMSSFALTAEAFAVGKAVGLQPTELQSLLGQCRASDFVDVTTIAGWMAAPQPEVASFRTEMVTKDLRYFARSAADSATPGLVANATHEYFLLSQLSGYGDKEGVTSPWKWLSRLGQDAD